MNLQVIPLTALLLILCASPLLSRDPSPSFRSEHLFSFVPPQKKGPEEKKWSWYLAGWYNRSTGNTDTLKTNAETRLTMDDNISNLTLSYLTFYGKYLGTRNENRGTGMLKFDHYVVSRVELFTYTQSEYNRMALLKYRNNTGAGVKYVFIKNPWWLLDLSGAPVVQYEKYETKGASTDWRWSVRLRSVITPVQGVECNVTWFYIPDMSDIHNYRTSLNAYLNIRIRESLALRLGYLGQHNSNALPGTKKTDRITYAQVGINL